MVGPEIIFSIYQYCFFGGFLREVAPQSVFYPQLTLPQRSCVGQRRRDRRWPHLACSIDVIVSKFALLEAEFLLRRAVTIVRDTSVINSSRSLMIQSMCISV